MKIQHGLLALLMLLGMSFTFKLEDTSIVYIKYGVTTPTPDGYWFQETKIDAEKMTTSKLGLDLSQYPIKKQVKRTDREYWTNLVNSIDKNAFFGLPEKIGDPGKRLTGDEWIEVKCGNQVHIVVFEYGANVKELKEVLTNLRAAKKKS